MNTGTNDLRKKSQKLAWLLRHGANEAGAPMDTAGFVPVEVVLRLARLTQDELLTVIAENNKSRYELSADGQRVRASQGHSMAGTPVTREGLEATWTVVTADDDVYHGTSVEAAHAILISPGINAAARTHVHLAEAAQSKVGKRAEVDVLLVVRPPGLRAAGLTLYRAPNGVLLVREVPRAAIVDVQAQTKAGERALGDLRARLA